MADFYNPEVKQSFPDSCAIKSQQLILNDFGIEVSEADLVQTAAANGWYNGGTPPQDVGNLLELANIPVTRQEGANVFNLVNELAQGHKVIVGLDANEMWYNDSISDKLRNWFNDFFGEPGGNHALIVAGIDTSDPNNIQVIVKDPGSGDDGKPYPLEQFMDAWSDANCYMVSTNLSVPKDVEGMANFDYNAGHIDNIAGLPYSDFQLFNDSSMGLSTFTPNWDLVPQMGGGVPQISPMTSLTSAYFDVAHNIVPFNQIFTPDYCFNDYLDLNIVNPAMCNTFSSGIIQMDMPPYISWNTYATDNGINQMTNWDYQNYLNDTIADFTPLTDPNMVDFFNQQMMMLDYCNCNHLDFCDTIYNPCMNHIF